MVKWQLRQRRCSRHAMQGVTLIEVLVTVLILAIGLLGLAALQNAAMQFNHSSYLRTHANNMAYDIHDRMRANRQAAMDGEYDLDTDASGPPSGGGTVAEQDLQEWWTTTNGTLPEAEAKVDVDSDGVATITIEWLDDRGEDERTKFDLNTRI